MPKYSAKVQCQGAVLGCGTRSDRKPCTGKHHRVHDQDDHQPPDRGAGAKRPPLKPALSTATLERNKWAKARARQLKAEREAQALALSAPAAFTFAGYSSSEGEPSQSFAQKLSEVEVEELLRQKPP